MTSGCPLRDPIGTKVIWARRVLVPLFCAVLAPAPAQGQADGVDAAVPPPRAVLERALANFNADRRERIHMVNHSGSREYRRELEVWMKRAGDGYRVLGTFQKPTDVRGTSFLVLPPSPTATDDVGSNQYFVYLPALDRLRRISGAQRADSFFGTHLSQGDVEPHPAEHYRILSMDTSSRDGEPVFELELEPRFRAGYDHAVFTVAQADVAILGITQFRHGEEEPSREILVKREWLETVDDHVLPSRMVVRYGRGRGHTEVEFLDRKLMSDIPESYFSTSHLLRRGH